MKNDIIEAINAIILRTGKDYATLDEIYKEVEMIRGKPNANGGATIRRTIGDYSSSSAHFKGQEIFVAIEKGKGLYRLCTNNPQVRKVINNKGTIFCYYSGNYKSINNRTPKKEIISNKKPDYIEAAMTKKSIGEKGELLILKFEKEYLISRGRTDLSQKVKHISKADDSKGYDILSFYPDTGREKHIEVKTTKEKDSDKVTFYITDNEKKHLFEDNNYAIYYVCDIDGKNPPVKQLDTEQIKKKFEKLAKPVLFKLNFFNNS